MKKGGLMMKIGQIGNFSAIKSKSGALISTLAATLSASCCVLPVILLTLGFASLGPFAVLMRYRSITLPFSFLALAGAFYIVYRPKAEADCANGVCSPKSLRRQRQIVWFSGGLMLLFIILASLPVTITLAR